MQDLISVVMPSLNQRSFLPEAVESVLGQEGVRLELIVADGGSTDGTQDWLANRAKADRRLRWHSQPDGGPAPAINRAMRQARGTMVGWLNSDDRYTPGALLRATQELHHRPDALMVYGHARHIDDMGRPLGAYPTQAPNTPVEEFSKGCFICQPTVVMRRSFLILNGPLDENLRTAFDFDWWLRAFRRFPNRIIFIEAVQAGSRLHAACITLNQRRTVALEALQLLRHHLGYAPNHWIKTWVIEALQSGEVRSAHDVLVQDVLAQARQYLEPDDWFELQQWLVEEANTRTKFLEE
jgi:glycosyltransferase involved in cell wall biosynthesis